MQNQELNRQIQRINSLINRVDKACEDSLELRSHWARYICILGAGFIENALEEIYGDFARRAASEPVANYVAAQLSYLQNPNTAKFMALASAFKSEWRDEIETFMNMDGRKEAIDSIMAIRHRIAHGESFNTGVSLVQIQRYLEKAIKVIELLEAQCNR